MLPSPSFIAILVLPPTASPTQNAPSIVMNGIVTPSPDIAKAPTSFIEPIKALSTVLYKDVTIIASIAGIEYFITNLNTLSSLNSFVVSILLVIYFS